MKFSAFLNLLIFFIITTKSEDADPIAAYMQKPYMPYIPREIPDTVIFHTNLIKLDPIATLTHYLPILLLITRFNIPPTEVFPPILKPDRVAMMYGMMKYFNQGT